MCLCASYTNPNVHYDHLHNMRLETHVVKRKWKRSVLCNKLLCKNLDYLHHVLDDAAVNPVRACFRVGAR